MWIHDLTKQLSELLLPSVYKDERFDCVHHVLNPSIMHWKDDLFIVIYRSILYRILKEKNTKSLWLHPWKIWDNGYKYYYDDPDRLHRLKFPRSSSFRKPGHDKYRKFTGLSPDFFIKFSADDHRLYDLFSHHNEIEIDTTSIAILQYTSDEWTVKHSYPLMFQNEMNHDARLHRFGDSFFISYNTYFLEKGEVVRMMYRPFMVYEEEETPVMYFLEERPMIHPKIARDVEKNCVFIGDDVLYSISSGECKIQKENNIYQIDDNIFWQKIFAATREYDAAFSLGTNVIPYLKNRWLMAGHVKIPYKSIQKTDAISGSKKNWLQWIQNISWKNIYSHGKYIYYTFFIELNAQYQITRVSHAFIPTTSKDSHLPFLLVFPSGLEYGRNREEILMAYGEGDVRTKVLSLTVDCMEDLLHTEEEMRTDVFDPNSPIEYRFELLDINVWNKRPRIFHFGYFFEDNAGDDQYVILFRLLQRKYAKEHVCRFRNQLGRFQEKEIHKDDIVIFGGGDIINPFFLEPLRHYLRDHKKYAVSIGMPYLTYEKDLKYFDTVSLRNVLDFKRLQQNPHNENKPRHLVSYPDLAFLLPFVRPTIPRTISLEKITVGISFPRTWYRRDSSNYFHLVRGISTVFRKLLNRNPEMNLVFIPFCVRRRKIQENDIILNNHFQQLLIEYYQRIRIFIPPDDSNYVWLIDNEIHKNVDFMICGRFHSHIFSINRQIPFVSLSASRKCEQLMIELQHEKYFMSFPKDMDDCPVFKENKDIDKTILFLENAIHHRESIKHKIETFRQNNIIPRLKSFLVFYDELLHSNLPSEPSSS